MAEPFETRIGRTARKNPLTSILSDVGKLQPQSVETEEAVLGALLLERDAITVVLEILEPDSFYKDEHKEIYEAILSLFHKSQPIDLLTVTNELRSQGKLEISGGAFYISELTNRISSAANIEFHARIVAQKYILRKLIEISTDIQRDAYDEMADTFDILERSQQAHLAIVQKFTSGTAFSIGQIGAETYMAINKIASNKEHIAGLPSGISSLDKALGGFSPGELIIIAARPGMGKTSLALTIAINLAMRQVPIAYLSLEMERTKLCISAYAIISGIDSYKIKMANQLQSADFEKLNDAYTVMEKMPLYIDDSASLTTLQLRAKALQLKSKHKIQMLVVDYLGLMAPGSKKQNREQEVSEISRVGKMVAMELKIPVVFLSQLSREVEKRGGSKRPLLSDLRDSGSVEQDADKVIFIYRPEYYGFMESEDGSSTKDLAELIIAKNRGGGTGTIEAKFDQPANRFEDIEATPFKYKNFSESNETAPY